MSHKKPISHGVAPATASGLAAGLGRAAWIVLAAMPLALAFANRSSVVVMALAAALALAGGLAAGNCSALARETWRLLRNWPGVMLLLFSVLAAASLFWHPFPRLGLFAMGEAFTPIIAATLFGIAAAAFPGTEEGGRRAIFVAFASLFALACVEVLVELYTNLAWRRALDLRPALFVLNKPVICFVVLYWPLVSLSEGVAHRGPILAGLGLLMAAAVFSSVSGTAMLALVAAAATFALARLAPRLMWGVVMLAMFAGLLLAPLKGDLAWRLVPDQALDRMQSLHARDRVEIWRSFGEVVELRPLAGVGFGVSPKMGSAPEAALVPEEHRVLLAVGHAHDMFLQIWSELGLLGALLAAAALGWLGVALLHLRREEQAPVLACLAAIFVIAQIGHGAWQGWWLAILGAAAIWFVKSFAATRRNPAQSSANQFLATDQFLGH